MTGPIGVAAFTLLLRKENSDLKLIPYDVLVTGPLQGMAQFIIAEIVSEYGMLRNYLRSNPPDQGNVGTYMVTVEPSVIDTFVHA